VAILIESDRWRMAITLKLFQSDCSDLSIHKLGQIKELLALTVLGLLSSLSASLLLKEATSDGISQHGNPIIHAYFDFAQLTHQPLNALVLFLAPMIWLLALLSNYPIPRLVLDCFGGYFVFRLMIGLIFINGLLFVPAVSPSLLLGQILVFIPFFVMVWGWLIWRIDCLGRESPQQIVALSEAKGPCTSFDYYHTSIYSVLNQGKSGFVGKTRSGRLLVLVHHLMLINVLGLALARVYGLLQKLL
jgi:hypothetical protein